MRVENGQIKDLVDAVDNTDAPTAEQATVTYQATAGVMNKRVLAKEYCGSTTVSGGSAVFQLTTDGTSGGTAIFPNAVFKESANFWVDNASLQYQFGGYTLTNSNRTLTITVNQLGSVLLGIIQFVTAANGVTVHLRIRGY